MLTLPNDTDQRGHKAVALVASGALDGAPYLDHSSLRLVPSQSKDGAFYITDACSCSCADAKYRKVVCKHQQAVRILNVLKLAEQTNRQHLEAVA